MSELKEIAARIVQKHCGKTDAEIEPMLFMALAENDDDDYASGLRQTARQLIAEMRLEDAMAEVERLQLSLKAAAKESDDRGEEIYRLRARVAELEKQMPPPGSDDIHAGWAVLTKEGKFYEGYGPSFESVAASFAKAVGGTYHRRYLHPQKPLTDEQVMRRAAEILTARGHKLAVWACDEAADHLAAQAKEGGAA